MVECENIVNGIEVCNDSMTLFYLVSTFPWGEKECQFLIKTLTKRIKAIHENTDDI